MLLAEKEETAFHSVRGGRVRRLALLNAFSSMTRDGRLSCKTAFGRIGSILSQAQKGE